MPSLFLDHDLGIEQCTGLKRRLAECLEQSDPLLLDGGAISRVHAASLQLLCALFRNRQRAGLSTHWVHASPILREAARLLGLSATLELSACHPPIPHPQHHIQDLEIAA